MRHAALGRALLAMMLGAACGKDSPSTRSIHALVLPDCAIDDVDTLTLQGLDDAIPEPSSFASVDPRSPSDLVGFPEHTAIVLARGNAKDGTAVLGVLRTTADDGPATGALFLAGHACRIPTHDGAPAAFPAIVGPAIGSSDHGALLAGGHDTSGRARADAIFIDAERTEATRIAMGLLRARDEAVVLPLGTKFIVAGGHDDEENFWTNVEVLDTAASPPTFDRDHLPLLSSPRVESAAVVLASGDGLLIGGRSFEGKALRSMEVIDAKTLTTRIVDVAALEKERRGARAVRLSTGEIAIVGGRDTAGVPVDGLEILTPDASAIHTIAFPAHENVDAVALPAGALLLATTDSSAPTVDLWLARLDGVVQALGSTARSGRPPRFVGGSDGAPFLWDGAFHRFDPWNGGLLDANLPTTLVPDESIDPFVLGTGVVVAGHVDDRGLSLFSARYDLRTALENDKTLGLGSTDHLSVDRLDGTVVPSRNGLAMHVGGARIAITDVTFGAFNLALGGGGRELPNVELRDEHGALVARIGDGATTECAWPTPPVSSSLAELVRDAHGGIELRIEGVSRTCLAPTSGIATRVSIVLVSVGGEANIHGITITRGG